MRRLLIIAAVLLVAGCNGGDGPVPPPDSTAPHVYAWDAPTTFADNTPLVPERDIREWELYASANGTFDDNSVPVAIVAALDNEGRIVTELDLLALAPHGVGPGVVIASKTVSIDNVGSGYSEPILW